MSSPVKRIAPKPNHLSLDAAERRQAGHEQQVAAVQVTNLLEPAREVERVAGHGRRPRRSDLVQF